MDIFSAVFATYMDAVSSTAYSRFTDIYGTDIRSEMVHYEGFRVSYSYQLWRVQKKSVCGIYSRDLNQKSQCSQAAKRMFHEMCIQLKSNPKFGWRYKKTKSMYCDAANNYEPIIATIAFADKSNEEKKRGECSVAILNYMQEATPANLKAKEAACSGIQ